jgi:hypothetical protein
MEDHCDGSMGGPILDIYDFVDVKDIMRSYKLELLRVAEADKLKAKRLQWEKTHIFKMRGNTAPTNPWRKLPVAGGAAGGAAGGGASG